MKKIFFILLLSAITVASRAQLLNPVQWSFSAKKTLDKDAKTYEIHLTALIDGNWHIYAQDAGEGPVPTTVKFTTNPLLTLIGKVKEEGKLEQSFDKNFNSTLKYYEKQVDFVQKVKLKSPASTVAKGTITFMICNDRQCLPPRDVPFSIKVGGK